MFKFWRMTVKVWQESVNFLALFAVLIIVFTLMNQTMMAGNEVDISKPDVNVGFQFFFETLRNAFGDLQYPEFAIWSEQINNDYGEDGD